jgi:anaerobic magnesium-protoporphyrin IX monomethyl ester cyclase
MLQTVNKGCSVKQNTKARQLIREAGIHYETFMLIGLPGETLEDIKLTRQWLLDNKPDDFDINIITPYPGSKIYDDAVPSTKFKDYKWEYKGLYFNKPRYSQEDSYYKGLNKQCHTNVRTNRLTNNKLKKLRDVIEIEASIVRKNKLTNNKLKKLRNSK